MLYYFFIDIDYSNIRVCTINVHNSVFCPNSDHFCQLKIPKSFIIISQFLSKVRTENGLGVPPPHPTYLVALFNLLTKTKRKLRGVKNVFL